MHNKRTKGFFYFTLLNLAPVIAVTVFFAAYSTYVNAVFAFKRHSSQGLAHSLISSVSFFLFGGVIEFTAIARSQVFASALRSSRLPCARIVRHSVDFVRRHA